MILLHITTPHTHAGKLKIKSTRQVASAHLRTRQAVVARGAPYLVHHADPTVHAEATQTMLQVHRVDLLIDHATPIDLLIDHTTLSRSINRSRKTE